MAFLYILVGANVELDNVAIQAREWHEAQSKRCHERARLKRSFISMLFIAIIVFILVTAGVVVLAFENMSIGVTFTVFTGLTLHLSVGLLLLLAFILGALVFYLITVTAAVQDRQELKQLRMRVADLEQVTKRVSSGQLPPVPPTAPIVPMPGMSGPDISDMPTQH